ncbi:MAG TPA: TraB/GumN family protein [Candidatus Aquabacterium excrementipullorum]|nr:TraB/GumN family protein [Candidatus Aquabacterium excrementipullorum]
MPVRSTGSRLLRRAALMVMGAGWALTAWSAPPATCPPPFQMPDAAEMQKAVASATEHGLLWRITKDGRSSYLYGSLHLGRLSTAFPGPKMAEALRNADLVALELDVSDPKMPQTLKAAMAALPASAHQAPPELLKRLEAQRQRLCMPAESLAGMPPLLQVMTLMVTAAGNQGLSAMWAQEVMLVGWSQAAERPVVGLETAEAQLRALVPNDPAEAALLLDRTLTQLEDGTAERVITRVVDSWVQGRIDDLARYDDWCDCMKTPAERRFMAGLMDARNPQMAKGVDTLHKQGKRVFAAVGALHMVGDDGLPSLLARMGYQVTRVF